VKDRSYGDLCLAVPALPHLALLFQEGELPFQSAGFSGVRSGQGIYVDPKRDFCAMGFGTADNTSGIDSAPGGIGRSSGGLARRSGMGAMSNPTGTLRRVATAHPKSAQYN